MSEQYSELVGLLREAATLATVGELLAWDQETMMPPAGAHFRAEEQSLIARLVHARATHERVGELLATCEADADLAADPLAAANLREIRRDFDRARKLPEDLVAELTETASLAMEAWKRAREQNDFRIFLPWLERQLRLNRRKAACYGAPPGGEPYDTLVEDYEPGMTGAEIERLFAPLREALTERIRTVAGRGRPQTPDLDRVELPRDRQEALNRRVLERLGFDLSAGRMDVSMHPFSIGLGPDDTRITTRYRSDGFLDSLGSTMHEAGHALYEQGLPKRERFGQPLAEPASLGIHESQSRLWENQVGRSRAFWSWAWPEAQAIFGGALDAWGVEDAFRAVNLVRPNLIRVESDELTYNLHIMLRFDLERALIRDDLRPADLPGAWNERLRTDLGLEVPDDRRGCLQDIHWSMGSFGYFPTYTLGNLLSAQLWEAAAEALPHLETQLGRGEFGALLDWLRCNVHAHGRRHRAPELCRLVTGRPLEHAPLLRHLDRKLEAVYGLDGAR